MATYKDGKVISGVDWDYFDKFEAVLDKYMPRRGEGETIASQIVTAVNKLIYKWYNDGDVFDNTMYLTGWVNDLSSYANWLDNIAACECDCDDILERVYRCKNGNEYEYLLKDLADMLLNDEFLTTVAENPKAGSIYKCRGRFEYIDRDDDEDEYEEWEDHSWDDDEEEE